MAKRKIIKIDEKKCNGCSLCIPNCPEGALQIIDKKARLISDLFCDGLGACIGHCPEGAITIEEREAERYNEKKVMGNIVKQSKNVIKAHLKHLKDHGEEGYLKEAMDFLRKKNVEIPSLEEAPVAHDAVECPGCKVMEFTPEKKPVKVGKRAKGASELKQWPVQIMLVPALAPYLNNSDLLIAADCVPFAYPDFHQDFLQGKTLLVGCPKLDDTNQYQKKFASIFKANNIKTVTYAHMEVPCCLGMIGAIKSAISESSKNIPFEDVTISIKGVRL